MPAIGYLSGGTAHDVASPSWSRFLRTEPNRLCRGKTLAIEYRWAEGHNQLPALATDLSIAMSS